MQVKLLVNQYTTKVVKETLLSLNVRLQKGIDGQLIALHIAEWYIQKPALPNYVFNTFQKIFSKCTIFKFKNYHFTEGSATGVKSWRLPLKKSY